MVKSSSLHLVLIGKICLCFASSLFCANEFILMVPLYNEKNTIRIAEYIYCLEKNIAHDMIKNIHVIYDVSNDDDDKESCLLKFILDRNLQVSYIDSRPTYQDFFNLADTLYPNQAIILSNADIYFNETLYTLKNFNLDGKFLALTRYNVLKNGGLDLYWLKDKKGIFDQQSAKYSQDVWIFKTPLPKLKCDILVGTWTCDSRLAYQISRTHLKLLNPCLTIQCCHVHLSDVRNYEIKWPNEPCIPVSWCSLS